MREDFRVRELSIEIYRRVREGWRYATEVTADVFREAIDLTDAQRVAIVENSRDMIRHSRRLESLIALGGISRTEGLAKDIALWAALELVQGRIDVYEAKKLFPGLDWREVTLSEEGRRRSTDPLGRLVDLHSMPAWIAPILLREYGESAEALAIALNANPPRTLRTNTLKTTREALKAALADEGIETRPTKFSADGLVADSLANVFRTECFKNGFFEVQDEASQLGAEAVMPPPRGFVVDACAGAGGKSLAIAASLANKGAILALDIAFGKIEELRRRARRAGAHQIQAVTVPASEWPGDIADRVKKADRIFVDAPCSGTGSWRRNPEAKWQMTEDAVRALGDVQFGLASRAATHLKAGARLIYATCSLLGVENETIVERLIAAHPELEPVRITELWGAKKAAPLTDPTGTYLKLAPHIHGTDGFFAAVFRKRQ